MDDNSTDIGGTGNYSGYTVYSGVVTKPDPGLLAVLQGNDLPFYTAQDDTNGTWTIFLRGEYFPAVIDGMITRFDVAKDLVNRYNACVLWFINR